MAVEFDAVTVRHADAAGCRDAADIVAAEIEQHQMLGPFLRIRQQIGAIGFVLRRRPAAWARAGDRPDRHLAVAHADEDLGAGADQRKAGQIEMIEEGRGIDPPQRAIELEWRQGEGRGEALREDDLKDVARDDIILRLERHRLVARGIERRRVIDRRMFGAYGRRQRRAGQPRGDRFEPIGR